jgi:hypothetical protein
MGFDKNDSRPIIQPSKKTTQVNLVMVGMVLIFLLLGAGTIIWMSMSHGPN